MGCTFLTPLINVSDHLICMYYDTIFANCQYTIKGNESLYVYNLQFKLFVAYLDKLKKYRVNEKHFKYHKDGDN